MSRLTGGFSPTSNRGYALESSSLAKDSSPNGCTEQEETGHEEQSVFQGNVIFTDDEPQ